MDEWRISAIGQNPSPAGWLPKPAARVAGAEKPFPIDSHPEQQLRNAVFGWLDAGEVQLLRLDQTWSGQERSSEMASLGAVDPKRLSARDLLDMDTAFVQASQRFADKYTGPLCRLSVQTRKDISADVPFWGECQDFYFVQDQGAWKIFAVF